jgi:hypothetical protein
MPVRFFCPICQQLLSVASRKVGSKVNCPKCQFSIVVPAGTPAGQSVPQASKTQPPARKPPEPRPQSKPKEPATSALWLSDSIVFDDIPAALESKPMAQPVAPPAADKQTPRQPPGDRHFVAVSRRMLHIQAVIILLISLAALAAGYYIGRGARGPSTAKASPDPVAVQGHVSYQAESSPLLPDAQAVVIVFPQGGTPADKIPIAGLRPDDPPPAADNNSLKAVESSDGVYRRADDQGQFELRLPPGVYKVLVISKHAQRPPGAQPNPEDVLGLGGYFQSAVDLIGPYRYEYSERRLPDEAPLEFTWTK